MATRLLRRSTLNRLVRLLLLVTVIWTFIDLLHVHQSLSKELEDPPPLNREKIYIASLHWNNEMILRSHWNNAVLDIARQIGSSNVYVSVHERGSEDDTKGVLRLLESKLTSWDIRNKFVLDPTPWSEEVTSLEEQAELRRPHLPGAWNFVLEPLYELQMQGERFDKILFLDTVVFTDEDVRTLISTRDGDYAAACSLDFQSPPKIFDTTALRDSEGNSILTQTWPFFRSRGSRRAIKSNSPVSVSSCWNGLLVMDAAPFYDNHLSFRAVDSSLKEQHVDGSERCLIQADNPLAASKGVWLNPAVRVAYDGLAYDSVSKALPWSSTLNVMFASWENRILRWATSPWFNNQIVEWRVKQWKKADPSREENGMFCLIKA